MHVKTFTDEEVRSLGKEVGIDFSIIDFQEFKMGLEIEMEHGLRNPNTNVTNDDSILTAKIAWAHLREIPDYYTRLVKMEADAGS